MLYAFFDDRGVLRQDPFRLQVDVALGTQASGVAILGLGTEVSKLTFDERIDVLEVVAKRIDGRKPLLATVYGDTITEQIEFSKQAIQNGTSALMLQPPSQKMDDAKLMGFFSKIIIAKLECNAVNLESVASDLGDSVMLFNGRCGLELPDNLRAGACGLIPAIDTVDKTSEIFAEFTSGNEELADKLYADLLPVLCFVMQGIPHFLTYGKMLAAARLGIELGGSREHSLPATDFGTACIRRFMKHLGPLN
jgi:4-hydroxy-tetrahydrodipicolinate synthase